MSSTATPTFREFVESYRSKNRPVHVAVGLGRASYPAGANKIAESIAAAIAGEDGDIVRDSEDMAPDSVGVIALDGTGRESESNWMTLREMAPVTRSQLYRGLVVCLRSADVTPEVFHAVDLFVRVRRCQIEGVYQPRLDHPGADWYLRRIESEVIES